MRAILTSPDGAENEGATEVPIPPPATIRWTEPEPITVDRVDRPIMQALYRTYELTHEMSSWDLQQGIVYYRRRR